MKYGTLISNTLHPAPRAIRIGGAVVCNPRAEDFAALNVEREAQGYTAREALTDCDYIEEGFGGAEAWSALLDGAADALGKTRSEIDAFLGAIPTE